MKFLIAGLGNVGPKYEETRHNIGFKVADALCGAFAASYSQERYGEVCTARFKGRVLIILKPNTFMNLSGKAVNYWLQKEKIPLDRLIVVTDDLALPFGRQRLRLKGSPGGHNGLKSITETVGTQDFARLRIGIGSDFGPGQQVDYVLGNWSPEEEKSLSERVSIATETVKSFVAVGGPQTMTLFNNK